MFPEPRTIGSIPKLSMTVKEPDHVWPAVLTVRTYEKQLPDLISLSPGVWPELCEPKNRTGSEHPIQSGEGPDSVPPPTVHGVSPQSGDKTGESVGPSRTSSSDCGTNEDGREGDYGQCQ
jgi:hypothetical protein